MMSDVRKPWHYVRVALWGALFPLALGVGGAVACGESPQTSGSAGTGGASAGSSGASAGTPGSGGTISAGAAGAPSFAGRGGSAASAGDATSAGSGGGSSGSGGAPVAGAGGSMGGAAGSAGTAGSVGVAGRAGTGLVHPGGLLTQADLDRVRSSVAAGTEPWASAWNAIRTADAGTSYQPTVAPTITDMYALQRQGHAAYVLAIKWAASGDAAYATAAKRVLDGWVNTVTAIQPPRETTLRVGIGAVQMANAAEIIAHGFAGSAGWPPSQVTKAQTWFKNVVWPLIGAGNLQRSSNWGTSALAGCMATAVFADDRAKFDYSVEAFKNGFEDGPDGCSGVTEYICNATGQATEAGRDQTHPQGGVAHLVEVALMAWNQGTDLVTYENRRLVAGMEYLAQYNLGEDVPYDPNFADPCNVHPNWPVISTTGRGTFSPVYEMADRLFTHAGVAHPFTIRVLGSPGYRPERTNSDHPGMGTLTFR